MSIKELFKEIRESDFEIKQLEELVNKFIPGDAKINKYRKDDGNFSAIICKDIFDSNIYLSRCKRSVDKSTIKTNPIVNKGDLLMAKNGFTDKNKNGFCLYFGSSEALSGNNTYILKHTQNPKYLINSLLTENAHKQLIFLLKDSLSSVKSLHLIEAKKIKIPVASLELQEKIGNFLFKFAEYEKKLQQELEYRRKQFNYYKELVFGCAVEKCRLRNVGWEIKKLEEIATDIYPGNEITRVQLDTGNTPAVKCGDINSCLPLQFNKCISFVDVNLIKKPKYFEKENILVSKISNKRETIGTSTIYLSENKALAGNDVDVIKVKSFVSPKYLNYSLSSVYARKQIEDFSQSGTVFHLYSSKIKQLKIPLPSLEEQERIVNILDKLYDICENPDKGIQLLIKNNRKQYEYYRELIFDEIFKTVEKSNQEKINSL